MRAAAAVGAIASGIAQVESPSKRDQRIQTPMQVRVRRILVGNIGFRSITPLRSTGLANGHISRNDYCLLSSTADGAESNQATKIVRMCSNGLGDLGSASMSVGIARSPNPESKLRTCWAIGECHDKECLPQHRHDLLDAVKSHSLGIVECCEDMRRHCHAIAL